MRHSDPGGRFTVPFEQREIYRGIDAELRAPVGHHVQWIEFDQEVSGTDEIYDVADSTIGRRWREPLRIPAFSAVISQGTSSHNERGFYNSDSFRASVAVNLIEDIFPELVWDPDTHIRDRILYRGKIFVPTRITLRGLLRNSHTVLTVDALQQNPEEFVNDPQLFYWAQQDTDPPPLPFAPQRVRIRTTL